MGRFSIDRVRRVIAGAALAVALCPPAAVRGEDGFLEGAGVGAGTALLNLLYIPAKLGYATLGGVTGGLAYALTGGNTQTATRIWAPTMGGTYVLSPDMLRGEEAVRFTGSSPAQG